jgi:hypothetical protein
MAQPLVIPMTSAVSEMSLFPNLRIRRIRALLDLAHRDFMALRHLVSIPGFAAASIHGPVRSAPAPSYYGPITVSDVPDQRERDSEEDALFDANAWHCRRCEQGEKKLSCMIAFRRFTSIIPTAIANTTLASAQRTSWGLAAANVGAAVIGFLHWGRLVALPR